VNDSVAGEVLLPRGFHAGRDSVVHDLRTVQEFGLCNAASILREDRLSDEEKDNEDFHRNAGETFYEIDSGVVSGFIFRFVTADR
jgi:hypothetical protein